MQRYLRASVFAVIVLLLLAIPITAVLARSYFLAPTAYPTPTQPITFPHVTHVTGLGLDCTFCHRMATPQALVSVSGATTPEKGDFTEETGGGAYLPALQQCMFCHKVIPTTNKPDLQRLVDAFNTGTPIEWKRVHQMPDHVHFVHSVHINAGFQCSTCHGDVGKMTVATRARDLRMGDCINCHQQNGARTDCAVCHY
jgi:hypothetical protein